MLQTGYVEEIQGNIAKVRMQRGSMCGSCKKCGLLAPQGSRELLIDAKNARGALPGDWVRVEMDSSDMLLAAFIVYMVPLIFGVVGYPIGFYLSRGVSLLVSAEVAGIGSGVVFFLASFILIRAYDRHAASTKRFLPTVREIVAEQDML